MKIGPKYKIARRLGAHLFDKTQTSKFALAKKNQEGKRGRPGSSTNFRTQLLEKQRVRFSYGVGERQFKRYVKDVIAGKRKNQEGELYQKLETRLDNAVYRIGLANSRPAARQLVSHGHITVNDKRITIPSYNLKVGEIISIRDGSRGKNIFKNIDEVLKEKTIPSWLKLDLKKKDAVVAASPEVAVGQSLFDLRTVIEFYKR